MLMAELNIERRTVGQRDVNRTKKAIRMIKYNKIGQNWQLQAVVRQVYAVVIAVAVVAVLNHYFQFYVQ